MLLSPLAPVLTPWRTSGGGRAREREAYFYKACICDFILSSAAPLRAFLFIFSSALVPPNVSPCKAPSSTQNPFCNPLHVHLFQAENFPKITKKNINKPNHTFSWNSSFQFRLAFSFLNKRASCAFRAVFFKIIRVCSCFVFPKICDRQECF